MENKSFEQFINESYIGNNVNLASKIIIHRTEMTMNELENIKKQEKYSYQINKNELYELEIDNNVFYTW